VQSSQVAPLYMLIALHGDDTVSHKFPIIDVSVQLVQIEIEEQRVHPDAHADHMVYLHNCPNLKRMTEHIPHTPMNCILSNLRK